MEGHVDPEGVGADREPVEELVVLALALPPVRDIRVVRHHHKQPAMLVGDASEMRVNTTEIVKYRPSQIFSATTTGQFLSREDTGCLATTDGIDVFIVVVLFCVREWVSFLQEPNRKQSLHAPALKSESVFCNLLQGLNVRREVRGTTAWHRDADSRPERDAA